MARIRRSRRVLLYVALAGGPLLVFRFAGYEPLMELDHAWLEEAQVERAIAELKQENVDIEAAIKNLGPDGDGIEKIAREDLGWAQPGEIVIKIPEKK